ncbi:brachyurin-like [Tigriopus californicus]|uniref:brachyurin-like n=1 Tax=Tigriopus californicus TaxID=6832 RepID=UPI0027DA3DFC|nr:brachyurin-like [Tigriopus californicus]
MSLPMVFGFIMKVIILLALVAGAMASPAKYSVIRDLSKYQDRSVLYPGIFKGANKLHRPNLYSKIVGGEEAVPHSYPFIVGMFIDDMYFCGGSILNENWILTASHCMDGANTVEVIAGAHNIREDEPTQQKMVSSEYTVHEGWTNNLVEGFDVTVIKLPQPLEFNENVQPITRTSSEPAVGDLVTAIGWGKPSDSAAGISDTLNMVDKLDIIDRATCGDTYGSVLSEDINCISAKDGRGTCNGDSGVHWWMQVVYWLASPRSVLQWLRAGLSQTDIPVWLSSIHGLMTTSRLRILDIYLSHEYMTTIKSV